MYHIIDLHFQNQTHTTAAFLVESNAGPVLIETGPYRTYHNLEKGLALYGYKVADVKHVLLSHIHFDHAGAAWALAREGATIYLHPFGIRHMHDPTKLVASATMIYGDRMGALWGEMNGIPQDQLRAMQPNEALKIGKETFIALYTPGHAKHHIAWQWGETVFTGDVGGVKIDEGPVVPPCPPPDIDLESWGESIDLILSKQPLSLVLTHYGEVKDPVRHMKELKEALNSWAFWVQAKWESGYSHEEIVSQFTEYIHRQLCEKEVSSSEMMRYEAANPPWMSVAGLIRYWKKKAESEA